MRNTFHYFHKTVTNSFLLLAIILLAQSCNKKKQVYHKKTDNTAEIYRLAKKGDSLHLALQDDSAVFYFNKAQLLCNPKRDYANQYVYILAQIGYIYQRTGDYYNSEKILTKAFPYLKYTSRPRFSQLIYTYTANNYYNNYDYDNALLYHKKALKIAISQFRKAQIRCDIGFIYMSQKKYLKAINILEPLAKKKVIDQTSAVNTELQYAAVLYNLGLSYLYLGNHQELALENLNKSLEITLKTKDNFELIGNYHALYMYYKKYPNPKLKKYHAMKGYISARKANSITYQINCLAKIIEAEDGKNLKKYMALYIKLTDSVNNAKRMIKNQSSAIKFHFKKDKDENLELKTQRAENELELARQKNRSYILYVIISLSLFSLLFLFFHITSKGKRERNDAAFKSELRISQKLDNELNTEVFQLYNGIQHSDLEDPKIKENLLNRLDHIYAKTRKISKENSVVLTDENYTTGLKEMISGYTSSDLNIIINGLNAFSWSKIDRIKKINVFRIIQELFEEIKGYGNASLVSISFKKNAKNIQIIYIDNSTEINDNSANLKKRLQNVENRIKTIKGTINFESNPENGFKVSFTFPI